MEKEVLMEARLWEYIDGLAPEGERKAVEALIAEDLAWREKYAELMQLHQLLPAAAMDAPSMRFTKNVLEEISRISVQPAARQYINRHIIRGIAAFFITTLALTITYSFGQADWTGSSSASPLSQVDYSPLLSPSLTNGLLGIQVVLGLFLFDRYLDYRKRQHRRATNA